MEEVQVAGSSSSPSPSCCGYNKCTDGSRSARRRRMEIRRFKLLANASCNKRLRLCHDRADTNAASSTNADVEVQEKEEKNVESESLKVCEGEKDLVVPVAPAALPSVAMDLGERYPPYGVESICGRRREMEDALQVVPALGSGYDGVYHFFAVYDGHGGSQVAFHCKNRLHEALAEEICSTFPQTETDWKAAMKSCFLKMDGEVAALTTKHGQGIESQQDVNVPVDAAAKPGALDTVGSTAVVAVVGKRQIVVANCGDSRAVLSRGGRAIPLSMDHKPELPGEMERIEAAGGKVIYWNGYRVFGVLAMSRAIGDKYFKPFVIAEPELSFTERSEEDECLILASDGLWDVLSNQAACEIWRKCLALRRNNRVQDREVEPSAAATAAALLTELALARGSTDNISVVVVDLRRQSAAN